MRYKNPKTGVGILLFNDNNQLLLIKRNNKKAEGFGSWAPPGGYVGWGEHFFDASKRETKEEVGIKVNKVQLFSVTNEMLPTYHSITIWVTAKYNRGNIIPDNHEVKEYQWCEINNLPRPLFEPFKQLIKTEEWKTKIR